jgi:hypothetical protein
LIEPLAEFSADRQDDGGTAGRLRATNPAAALTTTAIIPEPHNCKNI